METRPAASIASARDEIDALVDEYRLSCLWYLRADFYPRTDTERLRTLEAIARYGDLAAFRRANHLRQWLSPPSSGRSVAS